MVRSRWSLGLPSARRARMLQRKTLNDLARFGDKRDVVLPPHLNLHLDLNPVTLAAWPLIFFLPLPVC